MKPTNEIAKQIVDSNLPKFLIGTARDTELHEAITAALDKERERAEKYRAVLQEIATYKVTQATCSDVDQKAGVINFTVGDEVELYDERAEMARAALKEVR